MKKAIFIIVAFIMLTDVNVYANNEIISESFDNDVNVFSATNADQKGYLSISRENGEAEVWKKVQFDKQMNGEIIFDFDLCISKDYNGNLFSVIEPDFDKIISVYADDNCLYIDGERLFEYKSDEWQSYEVIINIDTHHFTLILDEGSIWETDIGKDNIEIGAFDIFMSGDSFGTILMDNFAAYQKDGNAFYDTDDSSAEDEINKMYSKGIINGIGGNRYDPNGYFTRAQTAVIVSKLLGLHINGSASTYEDVDENDVMSGYIEAVSDLGIMTGDGKNFRPNDYVNFEEMNKILVSAMKLCLPSIDNDTIVQRFQLEYVGESLSDKTITDTDAELIDIGDMNNIFSDIDLPTKGSLGSDIKWENSSETISADGKVTRPKTLSPENVELKATVSKGSSISERIFNVSVLPCKVLWQSTPIDRDESKLLVPTGGADVEFEFDMIPGGSNINALIGFTDRDTQMSAFSDLPVIIRFNPDGYLDAYNSNQYESVEQVRYVPSMEYTIRLNINMGSKTYSAWVRENDGDEHIIAKDYQFRSTANTIENIGKCYLKYGDYNINGNFSVSFCTIAAPEELQGNYVYDTGYLEESKSKYSELESVSKLKMINSDISLPKYSGDQEIIWFSSDESVISTDGSVDSSLNERRNVSLTAVVNDNSSAARAVKVNQNKLSEWAVSYIVCANECGIIKDIMLEADFDPKAPISREYGAVLASRLYDIIRPEGEKR